MSAKTTQWKGRIKQAFGNLSGNRKLEREGAADRRTGEIQEQLTRATDKASEMVDKAADAVKGTISSSKSTSRRK